jgi:hypothetical protein
VIDKTNIYKKRINLVIPKINIPESQSPAHLAGITRICYDRTRGGLA